MRAVEVENLTKEYELGGSDWSRRSLYESLAGWRHRRGGRSRRRFLALDGVEFAIEAGEVVGVVGRNGAGKSTLLKILSRITSPTSGRAVIRGNLASLLEVGTGFHPELSGRENVYLNGTILGMSRREIDRKFDEIVDFAEVREFLDTPVKRYSSGMYVRLAFSVAAHLDADVLLVDEVLAVGDAAFQRKSLGKMGDVATSGRTVIFVSHNLGAVRNLCRKVLVLDHGRLSFDGPTEKGLEHYEVSFVRPGGSLAAVALAGPLADTIELERFELRQDGSAVTVVDPTVPLEISVLGRAKAAFPSLDVAIAVFRDGSRLFSCHDGPSGRALAEGRFRSHFLLPSHLLRPGLFQLGIGAQRRGAGEWCWVPEVASFEVREHWDERIQERDTGPMSVAVESGREELP
ncbi:MAG: ABC transporter ATP-binding protein [Thermoanaerobaculia bacterium]